MQALSSIYHFCSPDDMDKDIVFECYKALFEFCSRFFTDVLEGMNEQIN